LTKKTRSTPHQKWEGAEAADSYSMSHGVNKGK